MEDTAAAVEVTVAAEGEVTAAEGLVAEITTAAAGSTRVKQRNHPCPRLS